MRLFGFFVGVPVLALAIAVIWQLTHQMGMEQTDRFLGMAALGKTWISRSVGAQGIWS